MAHDILQNTLEWFQKAVPVPVSKNIHTQIGCHFEEVVEMIQEIEGIDPEVNILLSAAHDALHDLAEFLKANDGTIVVRETARIGMIDAIADQLVTAVGVAHMLHMDPVRALNEVNESNYSKFDENGDPIFNENRKIIKGPRYRQADLTLFV